MKTKLFLIVFLGILVFIPAYAQEQNSEKSKKGFKSDPNIPIFEIKNDQNQTVFAVYPGGVKIFIEDQLKATGGGFTVGRLGTGKATEANFLNVTPDSTRIYTNQNSEKGFAVGNLGSSENVENFLKLNKSNYFIGHNSGNKTTGLYNLFLGYESGVENSTGTNNTFLGYHAGYSNTIGYDNVFIGQSAGYSNTDGLKNVFIGESAGYTNLSSDYNTYVGYQAGYNATSNYNTAVGYQAGYSQTDWQAGTFLGYEAGKYTTGRQNVFLGSQAGRAYTSGGDNVCVGAGAGGSNDSPYVPATGTENIFIGYYTGYKCGAAAHNVIIGPQTPFGGTFITGSNNVYIGEDAGNQSEAASGNVFIGFNAGLNETNNNRLYIANSSTTTPLIFGDFNLARLALNGNVGVNRAAYGNSAFVTEANSNGWAFYSARGTSTNGYNQFEGNTAIGATPSANYALYVGGNAWTTGTWGSSDIRWKKNIESITSPLENIMKLRGVKFDWDIENYANQGFDKKKQIGLIAQEVELVYPELVKENDEGFKAISYDKLSAVLIEAVKEQQNQIESLKSEIELLKTAMIELKKEMKTISSESASNAKKD